LKTHRAIPRKVNTNQRKYINKYIISIHIQTVSRSPNINMAI